MHVAPNLGNIAEPASRSSGPRSYACMPIPCVCRSMRPGVRKFSCPSIRLAPGATCDRSTLLEILPGGMSRLAGGFFSPGLTRRTSWIRSSIMFPDCGLFPLGSGEDDVDADLPQHLNEFGWALGVCNQRKPTGRVGEARQRR